MAEIFKNYLGQLKSVVASTYAGTPLDLVFGLIQMKTSIASASVGLGMS